MKKMFLFFVLIISGVFISAQEKNFSELFHQFKNTYSLINEDLKQTRKSAFPSHVDLFKTLADKLKDRIRKGEFDPLVLFDLEKLINEGASLNEKNYDAVFASPKVNEFFNVFENMSIFLGAQAAGPVDALTPASPPPQEIPPPPDTVSGATPQGSGDLTPGAIQGQYIQVVPVGGGQYGVKFDPYGGPRTISYFDNVLFIGYGQYSDQYQVLEASSNQSGTVKLRLRGRDNKEMKVEVSFSSRGELDWEINGQIWNMVKKAPGGDHALDENRFPYMTPPADGPP